MMIRSHRRADFNTFMATARFFNFSTIVPFVLLSSCRFIIYIPLLFSHTDSKKTYFGMILYSPSLFSKFLPPPPSHLLLFFYFPVYFTKNLPHTHFSSTTHPKFFYKLVTSHTHHINITHLSLRINKFL